MDLWKLSNYKLLKLVREGIRSKESYVQDIAFKALKILKCRAYGLRKSI